MRGRDSRICIQATEVLTQETELGIPALIHCEASAGAQFTEADVFPSAIAQASTFEPELIGRMAEIIRKQMLEVGFRQALSPVVDIARDPRWGRVTETYGEDAALTSAMASAFVKGIQTDDLRKGIAATAKHYVGHGITEGGMNMGAEHGFAQRPERNPLQTFSECDHGSGDEGRYVFLLLHERGTGGGIQNTADGYFKRRDGL